MWTYIFQIKASELETNARSLVTFGYPFFSSMTQAYYIYYMENWSTINILVQIAVACMMCFDLYRCRGRAHGDGLMDRLGFEFGSCSPWPLAVAGGRRCNENACMHGPGRWIGAAVAVADEPTNQQSIIYHLSINHVLCDRLVSCWGHPCIISLSLSPAMFIIYHCDKN